jgi:hypothetical protein
LLFSALLTQSVCGSTLSKGPNLRSDVEEHAVCFSVAEALTLTISLAKRAASIESILCAARLEVVRWRGLDVRDNTAAWSGCGCPANRSAFCRMRKVTAEWLETRVEDTTVEEGCTGVADDDGLGDEDDDGGEGGDEDVDFDVGVGVGVG